MLLASISLHGSLKYRAKSVGTPEEQNGNDLRERWIMGAGPKNATDEARKQRERGTWPLSLCSNMYGIVSRYNRSAAGMSTKIRFCMSE